MQLSQNEFQELYMFVPTKVAIDNSAFIFYFPDIMTVFIHCMQVSPHFFNTHNSRSKSGKQKRYTNIMTIMSTINPAYSRYIE